MADLCRDFSAELHEFNSETDHVHLLVHHPPTVAISKLGHQLKTVSARYLRQEHATHPRRHLRGGHLWSPSYLAGSCGGTPLALVKDYTENQKRPAG